MIEIVRMWWLAGSWDWVASPDQQDDERRDQQQRRGVVRKPRAEAHDPVGLTARADDERESKHEQRVDEDRAEDRGLGDDQLARLEREDDDEELG